MNLGKLGLLHKSNPHGTLCIYLYVYIYINSNPKSTLRKIFTTIFKKS